MDDKVTNNLLQELKRGSLVLSVLLNSSEPCYGYSLVTSLNSLGVEIEQNTLYPLLRRLEKQGLLESSWDTSDNRPRKYYKISSKGKEVRDTLYKQWVKTNKALTDMAKKGETL